MKSRPFFQGFQLENERKISRKIICIIEKKNVKT